MTLQLTSTRGERVYEIWRRIQDNPLTYEWFATVPGVDGLHAVKRAEERSALDPLGPGKYLVFPADSVEEVVAKNGE